MNPEYRKALMDVADMVSKLRSQAMSGEDYEDAQIVIPTYDLVLRKLVAMMKSPPTPAFKYSPVPAIEADLRRRIDDE